MRKAKDSNDEIRAELETVVDRMQTGQLKETMLKEIVYQWCRKNYKFHVDIASDLHLKPAALILFALLYTNHPLLMTERSMHYGFLRAKAEILLVELEGRDVFMPP